MSLIRPTAQNPSVASSRVKSPGQVSAKDQGKAAVLPNALTWKRPAWQPKAWINDHLRVANDATGYVSQRLGSSLLVWLLVGIALALPALLWLAHTNLSAVGSQWQGGSGLTVYFSVAAEPQEIADTTEFLANEPAVAGTFLTTPEAALEDFLAQTADAKLLRDSIDSMSSNPLPASLAITIKEDVQVIQLEALARRLGSLAGITDVVIEKTWLDRLGALNELVQRFGLALAGLFSVGSILVTFASVRLAIESRLDELRIMALVGATIGQIRRPFVYYGAGYGLGGAMVGCMIVALVLNTIEGPLFELLGSYQVSLQIVGFDLKFLAIILLAGTGLGVLGALLAFRQRLRNSDIV